jgi:hypothetical protein
VLNLGHHFGKQSINTKKILKHGTGERWEKTHWPDRVRDDVLLTVEERNILQTIKWRKSNGIGHILHRNCLLKDVTEGKVVGRIEVTEQVVSTYCMALRKLQDAGN